MIAAGQRPQQVRPSGGIRCWTLLAAVALLAMVFALAEIQIEGAGGWAADLPTWRIERHILLDLFWGGRPLTGYHVWIFLFMFLVFHWPFVLDVRPSWRLEARVLGALMLFWTAEDFLWFVLNPAFGLSRFRPATIPWHHQWWSGIPSDYVLFLAVGGFLLWRSFRPSRGGPRAVSPGATPSPLAPKDRDP